MLIEYMKVNRNLCLEQSELGCLTLILEAISIIGINASGHFDYSIQQFNFLTLF